MSSQSPGFIYRSPTPPPAPLPVLSIPGVYMLRPDLKHDQFKTGRLFQNRSTHYKTVNPV